MLRSPRPRRSAEFETSQSRPEKNLWPLAPSPDIPRPVAPSRGSTSRTSAPEPNHLGPAPGADHGSRQLLAALGKPRASRSHPGVAEPIQRHEFAPGEPSATTPSSGSARRGPRDQGARYFRPAPRRPVGRICSENFRFRAVKAELGQGKLQAKGFSAHSVQDRTLKRAILLTLEPPWGSSGKHPGRRGVEDEAPSFEGRRGRRLPGAPSRACPGAPGTGHHRSPAPGDLRGHRGTPGGPAAGPARSLHVAQCAHGTGRVVVQGA